MIKQLNITGIFGILLTAILLSLFVFIGITFAQETSEEIASKYDITFPIAELGNCGGISECRTYCEDPVNATTCIDYAKLKGFYKEEDDSKKEQILIGAKQVLGCDSYQSCLSFCSVPSNHDKCDAFAKSQGLAGGQVEDPSKTQVLTRAKEFLGCDSLTGCQSFCSQPENQQKCSEFAKTVGLRGGEREVGPGGCSSEATCKTFCSDPQNYTVCQGFVSASGGKFSGPGGCDSESSCRAYCQQNPTACGNIGGSFGPPPGYNPQEMCNRTPKCAWNGTTCQCSFEGGSTDAQKAEEYARFCQENPEKCGPNQSGSFTNSAEREAFEKYCRENPDKCRTSFDPAKECTRYSGCSWTGTTCQCGSSETSTGGYATPYPSPSYGSRETQEAGCRAGGGTCDWSPGYCRCQGYQSTSGSTGSTSTSSTPPPTTSSTETQTSPQSTSTQDPAAACTSTSGCSWTGSSCQCGTTQGVNTNRGLLQTILEWIGL